MRTASKTARDASFAETDVTCRVRRDVFVVRGGASRRAWPEQHRIETLARSAVVASARNLPSVQSTGRDPRQPRDVTGPRTTRARGVELCRWNASCQGGWREVQSCHHANSSVLKGGQSCTPRQKSAELRAAVPLPAFSPAQISWETLPCCLATQAASKLYALADCAC